MPTWVVARQLGGGYDGRTLACRSYLISIAITSWYVPP